MNKIEFLSSGIKLIGLYYIVSVVAQIPAVIYLVTVQLELTIDSITNLGNPFQPAIWTMILNLFIGIILITKSDKIIKIIEK